MPARSDPGIRIQPFSVAVDTAVIEDLRARIRSTRLPVGSAQAQSLAGEVGGCPRVGTSQFGRGPFQRAHRLLVTGNRADSGV